MPSFEIGSSSFETGQCKCHLFAWFLNSEKISRTCTRLMNTKCPQIMIWGWKYKQWKFGNVTVPVSKLDKKSRPVSKLEWWQFGYYHIWLSHFAFMQDTGVWVPVAENFAVLNLRGLVFNFSKARQKRNFNQRGIHLISAIFCRDRDGECFTLVQPPNFRDNDRWHRQKDLRWALLFAFITYYIFYSYTDISIWFVGVYRQHLGLGLKINSDSPYSVSLMRGELRGEGSNKVTMVATSKMATRCRTGFPTYSPEVLCDNHIIFSKVVDLQLTHALGKWLKFAPNAPVDHFTTIPSLALSHAHPVSPNVKQSHKKNWTLMRASHWQLDIVVWEANYIVKRDTLWKTKRREATERFERVQSK